MSGWQFAASKKEDSDFYSSMSCRGHRQDGAGCPLAHQATSRQPGGTCRRDDRVYWIPWLNSQHRGKVFKNCYLFMFTMFTMSAAFTILSPFTLSILENEVLCISPHNVRRDCIDIISADLTIIIGIAKFGRFVSPRYSGTRPTHQHDDTCRHCPWAHRGHKSPLIDFCKHC